MPMPIRRPIDLFRLAGMLPAGLLASAVVLAPASAWGQAGQTPAAADAPAAPAAPAGREGDRAKVSVSDRMTVDLHVKDESIVNILELLSIQSQKNIIASKNVSGNVSADLYNVTFTEALDAILHVNGFGYVEKGNFIYVYTRSELAEIQKALSKRVAKVVRLNYLNAADAAEFVRPLLSEGGDIKVSAKAEAFTIPDTSPVGKDDYALGATLVVIDFEENVAAIEKLLTELDTRPAQVLVEATILQTSLTEENAFGVDFSLISDLDFTDFATLGGPRAVADALIRGNSGTPSGFSPADNRGVGLSTNVGNVTDPGGLKIGVISDDLSVFVRLLDQVGDTTVVSNPKILSLNRQPSRVIVGERIGYLNSTQTGDAVTQTVEFINTGVQLYFRPFVADNGEIRMELKPAVSDGAPRNVGTGTGTTSVVDENTQEIVTNVIVKDGMTIVLGGLFRESTIANRRQVPLLGDIPFIGAAFRGHDDTVNRDEYIFLIRPTIVSYADNALAGAEAEDTVERLRAGARQGLLPFSREKMTAALNVQAEAAARRGEAQEAGWLLQRSLSLNPRQPEALRLRELLTSQRELWPQRSNLDEMFRGEIRARLGSGATLGNPAIEHETPYGSTTIPTEPARPLRERLRPMTAPTEGTPAGNAQPGAGETTGQDAAAAATIITMPAPASDGSGTTLPPGVAPEDLSRSLAQQPGTTLASNTPVVLAPGQSLASAGQSSAASSDHFGLRGETAPEGPMNEETGFSNMAGSDDEFAFTPGFSLPESTPEQVTEFAQVAPRAAGTQTPSAFTGPSAAAGNQISANQTASPTGASNASSGSNATRSGGTLAFLRALFAGPATQPATVADVPTDVSK